MIKAKVTAVTPAPHGRDAKIFARAQTLISPENPKGEVMFYAAPPFWTGGREPHLGQTVIIGHIERKTSPHWPKPRWLARDVSSAQVVERDAPIHLHAPKPITRPSSSLVVRILAAIGIHSFGASHLSGPGTEV
ncbi:MAG TPA: hypothetical protein VHC20_05370 [Candidatus Paceibacterota bacterium]|nr:hypothetical protein [Candidatus Paceibacterota bacterium]